MTPIEIGAAAFACTLGGALGAMRLRASLPEHHLGDDSKDTVKLGIGLIATMTALVLGLVTASAKSSFDALDSAVKQSAVEVLTLDRLLARYGPETGEIRAALKELLGRRIELVWPRGSTRTPAGLDPTELMRAVEGVADRIRDLSPRSDAQRALQSRAVDLSETILQARWGLFSGIESSIPKLFLAFLLFWLTATFASFGLFAPRNGTVIAVLFVCALSVAGAVFLIYELDGAFDGFITVSAEPMRFAYAHLNR